MTTFHDSQHVRPILTPQEAAKRPWPATPQQAEAWTFDPIAQTWSRP